MNILDKIIEGSIHVVPLNDTIDHVVDGSCCQPIIDEDLLVIHSAKDCRETYERIHKQGKKNKPWINYVVVDGKFKKQ
jgi:hypothetical protein